MKNWLFPLWVIIDVLVALAALSMWIAAPEYKTLNVSLSVFAVALGGVLAFKRSDDIGAFIRTAYFKKMVYHGLNAFLVISIVALVNYLGARNFKEFDVTKEERNSLTGQSLKILEMVKSPLKFTVYSKREEWLPILNLLKLFKGKNKLISIEAIDTDVRPDLVKARNISQNGTVVITYNKQDTSFVIQDELSVTNALLKALRTQNIVLYMVEGHQEHKCSDKRPEGMSVLCDALTAQNYVIKTIDLTKTTEVPKDATALMILGPTSAFLSSEVAQIKAFLSSGGSLFLGLAPAFRQDLYKNLVDLAAPYGLTMGQDMVIDRLSTVQGAEATIPIVGQYDQSHPITAGFNQRTIFPLTSSVDVLAGKDSAVLLAFTSPFPGSWAEKDLKAVTQGKAAYLEGTDKKGPVAVLGVGESIENTNASRFALLGSSSFLVNGYQTQAGNGTLFLNTVSWLVSDEGIISFNRPGIEESPVLLSAQHLHLIFGIAILLIPIIFFGAAVFVYRRRRNL